MLASPGPSDAAEHLGRAVRDGEARTFGEVLKHERLAAGLTQEELAERASLSARAISDLERSVKQTLRRQTSLEGEHKPSTAFYCQVQLQSWYVGTVLDNLVVNRQMVRSQMPQRGRL